MSDKIDVRDTVDAILNPKDEPQAVWGEFNFKHLLKGEDFTLKQEVLPEGSAIVEEEINEILIVDLKGRKFQFPGSFKMKREGNKVTFQSY